MVKSHVLLYWYGSTTGFLEATALSHMFLEEFSPPEQLANSQRKEARVAPWCEYTSEMANLYQVVGWKVLPLRSPHSVTSPSFYIWPLCRHSAGIVSTAKKGNLARANFTSLFPKGFPKWFRTKAYLTSDSSKCWLVTHRTGWWARLEQALGPNPSPQPTRASMCYQPGTRRAMEAPSTLPTAQQ